MEKLLIYSVDKDAFLSKRRGGMYQPYVWTQFDPAEVFIMTPPILKELINVLNDYDELLQSTKTMSFAIADILKLFMGKYDMEIRFSIPHRDLIIKDAICDLMLIPMDENENPVFTKSFKLINMTSILDGQD